MRRVVLLMAISSVLGRTGGVKQNRLCSDPAPTDGEMNLVGADLAPALGWVVGGRGAAQSVLVPPRFRIDTGKGAA